MPASPFLGTSYKLTVKLIVIAVLALFVAVSALPQYVSGWPWATPPKLEQSTRSALQDIRDQGIAVPGWATEGHDKTKFGGHTWSIQQLSATAAVDSPPGESTSVFLLLRPQTYEADQPEVEWLDIKGSQNWTTDSHQTVSFELPADSSKNTKTVRINSDFFRAWNQGQTYAVVQWYAWPTGGSASVASWFWADQKLQWQQYRRMPWVAVSLWLPIAPLSEISPHQAIAESLGKDIHQTLLETVFEQVSARALSPESPNAVKTLLLENNTQS
ncbi:MAG: cyanoexosortase B system-associated protein [Phormidesmis sp.]